MSLLSKISSLDRRVIYLLLVVVICIPFFVDFVSPTVVTKQVRSVYDAVEKIPPGKVAVLSGDWSASTIAENQPQAEALVRHLFKRNVPFIILPFNPQTTTLMQEIAQREAVKHQRQTGVKKSYGRDWINAGWKALPPFMFLKSLAADIPGTLKADFQGTNINKLPAMKGVRTIKDIAFVCQITPTASLDTWIAAIQTVYGTPLAYAPTAVMVPQGYDPLDANQIVGMLPGMVGAAQYELLLNEPGNGLRWSNALSASEVLMIVLILLGNIGLVATRKSEARR